MLNDSSTMTTPYQGQIKDHKLYPKGDALYMLDILVTIPDVAEEVVLSDEGSLPFLEDKYPFIVGRGLTDLSFSPVKSKYCLVTKDGENNFRYAGYMAQRSN